MSKKEIRKRKKFRGNSTIPKTYCDSITPNFSCCKKNCVMINLMASANSEENMTNIPRKLSFGVEEQVVAVPNEIINTLIHTGMLTRSIFAK
jgi:hypothetical protein